MRVRAELMERGKRIHLEAVDGEGAPLPIRVSIPGAYFRDRSQRWSLPLGMATCRLLRTEYGEALEIGPGLWEWAKEQTQAEKRQKATGSGLGSVELPRITQEFPRLAQALQSRPYQTRAARFVADGRVCLLADDPGLGKTTEAIAGIMESGQTGPYLIAAPSASLHQAWAREIHTRIGEHARIRVITGSKAKREEALSEALRPDRPQDVTWIIINIEMLRTKSWWICPQCERTELDLVEAENDKVQRENLRMEEENAAMAEMEPMVPLRPLLELEEIRPEVYRWEASDKPKSEVIDCGHNPGKVRLLHEHQFQQLFDVDWGALIMDECQRSLLRNTGKQSQVRNGAMLLRGEMRIAASGTPMRGKPTRLWGILNWMDRKQFSGRWAFIQRYWKVTASGYGGALEIGDFIVDRAEIFNTDLDRYMLRRSKVEVSPELPPKAYMGTPLDPDVPSSPVAVWMPMSEKQEKAFRRMAVMGIAEVDGGEIDALGILAIMTRLKQFGISYGQLLHKDDGEPYMRPMLPSNKYDWVEQFLLENNIIGDPDEEPTGKVVVVSQFTEHLQVFANNLFAEHGLKYARLTGAVTGKKRDAEIDRFNDLDSGTNVMFLNTIAGGVSVTLDSADDMVFLDETHVPDDQKQAEGRIDNRRPEVKVAQRRYWYLKSLDSLDEAIAHTNMRREADQAWHLDGRRGVEYAREIFATLEEMTSRGGRR
jgi:SNF2 family DNA or RNA helicase